jgi:hypothetical protein
MELSERCFDVLDRAQHQRDDGGVERFIRPRQSLGHRVHDRHRHRRLVGRALGDRTQTRTA